jgi:hypothetical protein
MRCALAFALFLAPQLLPACHCVVSWSACQDAAASNVVFVGTVETVEPELLDRWGPSAGRNWTQDREIADLRKNKSESGLRLLKERYLKLLFDLPEGEKARIQSARTQEELQTVMTWLLSQGTKVRFRVRTLFHQQRDDGEDTGKSKFIDVWNESGDCGIPFQKGETYLVYATDDEESDHLGTSVCHRTARLSDAGEDLAYLYFIQNGGAESTRLEGFVTSQIDQMIPYRFHYSGTIKSPVSDVVIELKSAHGARYTEPDPNGRFVFDGLAEGDYRVSAFEAGFPARVKTLSGPKRIHIQAGTCAVTTLLVLLRESAR